MNALRKTRAEEGYEYCEVPRPPAPGPGEALVRWDAVAICGSDIPLWLWNSTGQTIAELPFTPGHECCGEIIAVGESLQDGKEAGARFAGGGFNVGDRVCAETHIPCQKCYQCTNSREDICADMGLYGHGKKTEFGGCAEMGLVPLTALYKLKHPESVPPRLGALMEPFGVAHNACSEASKEAPLAGDTVLVLGAGPIGIFAAAIARASDAGKIIVVDILGTRLQLAERMGAHVIIDSSNMNTDDIRNRVLEETDGDGAGVLFECTGAPPLVNACFSFMRKGGRAVLVGLPKAPLHIENVLGDFIFRAITVKSIHGRRMFSTWEACEELIATGKVVLDPVITHEFPLSEYQEAFRVLLSGNACKVVMYPGK